MDSVHATNVATNSNDLPSPQGDAWMTYLFFRAKHDPDLPSYLHDRAPGRKKRQANTTPATDDKRTTNSNKTNTNINTNYSCVLHLLP